MGLLLDNKYYSIEWLGVILALFGFVSLMLPGVISPSFYSFVFMSFADIG